MNRTRSVIRAINNSTPSVLELSIVRADGGVFPNFKPGQYVTLSFPGNPLLKSERSFSIASSPTDRKTLRFGIRVIGRYTNGLRTLRSGGEVMVSGPYGQFAFDKHNDKAAVLIAGGIGVTPFMSMVRAATELKLPNDMTLIYCIRSLTDAPYIEELNTLERMNPNLHVQYVVSDGNVPDGDPRFFRGRITRELLDNALSHNLWGRSYFLCGPPPFMKSVTNMLRALGLPVSSVRTERFGVGSSALIERGVRAPKLVFAAWGTATAILFGLIIRVEQHRRSAITVQQQPSQNVRQNTGGSQNVLTPQQNNTKTPVTPTRPSGSTSAPSQQYTPPQPSIPTYRTVPRTTVS